MSVLGVAINPLAVFVAAIVVFVIGGLWYSPLLFGKIWVKAHGYTPQKIEAMRTGVGRVYAVSFLCYLVMAIVVAILIGATDTTTALGGVRLGAICLAGFRGHHRAHRQHVLREATGHLSAGRRIPVGLPRRDGGDAGDLALSVSTGGSGDRVTRGLGSVLCRKSSAKHLKRAPARPRRLVDCRTAVTAPPRNLDTRWA